MRWAEYWGNYVGADGYLPTGKDLYEAWKKTEFNKANNPTADWTLIGPIDSGEFSGGQPGIGRINSIVWILTTQTYGMLVPLPGVFGNQRTLEILGLIYLMNFYKLVFLELP